MVGEKKLKIVIVEDMAVTRVLLEEKLNQSNYEVAGSFSMAETAWESLKTMDDIDLILLDIHLAGEKNGIWLAHKIREHKHIPIVFLTAYGDDRSLQEVIATNPDGFLMKPYKGPTLITTIKIALKKFRESNEEKQTQESPIVYIKDSLIRVKLVVNDILFIQSSGNYLYIHLENKRHTIRSKMGDFYNKLPSGRFVRVHQSFVINIREIQLLGSDHLNIRDVDIPIGAKYKANLLGKLDF